MNVKLNDVREINTFTWAGEDLLVCATFNKYSLRFLKINSGDTYVIHGLVTNANEKHICTTVSYLHSKGLLCAGSDLGNVTMWKKNTSITGISGWEELSTCKIRDKISYVTWGFQNCAIIADDSLYILQEHELCSCYNKKVCVIQKTSNEVVVVNNKKSINLKTDLKIIGVAVSEDHVAVWSGKTVAVYNLTNLTALNVIGTFGCECETIHIYEQILIIFPNSTVQNNKLLIYTFQGTLKQCLDSDGRPVVTHLNQNYLVTATIIGIVQIWDLSRREAKLHTHPKDLVDSIEDFGEVVMIRINCTGTKVSMTIANSNLIPSPHIYVWDSEINKIVHYLFENTDAYNPQDRNYITAHYWDSEESQLLVCETRISITEENDRSKIITEDFPLLNSAKRNNFPKLVTLFVSKENGIIFQDAITMASDYVALLGVDVPYFIIVKRTISDLFARMDLVMMNYFDEELANNVAVHSLIIKFNFSLSTGNLDDALKIISNINNINVWTNLTKMCIKKKRLDVAQICLGNMKDARGVFILRTLDEDLPLEVKLAVLATHLGMLSQAEDLYKSVERYDLLNKMYQNLNRWDEAISIAEKLDRIHLRNTYDAYGRYLETIDNVQEAIKMYEFANTHCRRIPRLLLRNSTELEKYIQKSNDPKLLKWWAQYVESTGNMDLALKYYEDAKDYLSKVRILCFLENTDQAAAVANVSGDAAACYHLARHYENLGQIENAVHFFMKSNVYTNAVRICKEHGLDDQLWQISLYAGQNEKLEAAKYFENIDPHRSIILYQKAENFNRALHLAFKFNILESIEQISFELNPNIHAELLEKCAEYFIGKDQFEAAVKLLAVTKKFDEAISICNKRRVHFTEELGELLTPDQNHPNKNNIINEIGELSFLQGNYHLAAKKFTQAGNKLKAMKALLKSGDTEKIIFFANVSREKEIYIMAANYLQTLDWQMQPEYLKHIINFYTKGKAPHLLANFYIACAQIEVDEYGNYEKSIGALNEASRCLSKDPEQFGQALEYITKKITSVKKFLEIRRLFEKNDGDKAIIQCRQFLNSDVDLVRRGDIYSLMIEYLVKNKDWNSASQIALEMKKNLPNDNLMYYVPKETLQKLGIEILTTERQKSETVLDEIEDISSTTIDNFY